MKVVVVAGTQSGVGSTTVSICLMNMLRKQGLRVQAFKFGPGFVENDLFEAATGRMAVNLVPWSIPRDCLLSCLYRCVGECDIGVIDGSAGLFDRREDADGWSTAELARVLMTPVVLVVDARAMGQSCAALVKGFETFEKKVKVAGVVLNRVSHPEHASVLSKALCKDGVKAECIGSMIQDDRLLTQAEIWEKKGDLNEEFVAEDFLKQLACLGQDLNTSKLIDIATTAKIPRSPEMEIKNGHTSSQVKIGVAKDAAFSFYYHENFMMLEAAGAELTFFSPLEDHQLPEGISGIYFGGGHPEFHIQQLARNTSLLASIRSFAAAGGVIYAEGGGLSYLSKSIENEKETPSPNLVGLFPFRITMLENLFQGNVSVTVEMLNNCSLFPPSVRAKGHICHRSQIRHENIVSPWEGAENKAKDEEFDCVYRLYREDSGYGSAKEGYSKGLVIGSYVHLQFASDRRLAPALVKKCKEVDLTKIQESVKQALMNVNIQMVKNGTPRKLSSKKFSQTESELIPKRLSPVLYQTSSSRFNQEASTFDQEENMCSYYGEKPNISSPFSHGSRSFALRKQTSTPVYYTREFKMNEMLTPEVFSKNLEDSVDLKKKELRKSFSLDDVGIASQDGRTHFGNTKIVGLSSTAVEMVCALGLDHRLIGITNLCKYPENIQNGRRVVATTKFEASHLDDSRLELKLKDYWCRQESAFVIDEDFLKQEQPSLVIVEHGGDPGKETLDQIFKTRKGSFTGLCPSPPTNILAHKCLHLSEILQFMLQIAQAAGVEDTGALVVDKLRSRVAKIGSLIATDFPVEKVVVLTCLNPLMIGGYWIPEMVTLAGGECLGAKAGHPHQRVTWQELKSMEPEVLILAAASWEETKEELVQLASLPGWWAMPAMKTGQLYVCDPRLFSMAGPRLVDGIELLARILHPSSAGQYGKQGMAWSCTLRGGKRCRPCYLYRQFCTLL